MILNDIEVPLPPPTPDPAWGIGLGVTLFVVSAGVAWASLHLRGATHDRLRKAVDIAYAGLAEQAVEVLRGLRSELDLILPDMSDPFDPGKVVVDPTRVEAPAKLGIKILKQRQKIVSHFRLLLLVCTFTKWVAIAFCTFVALSTVSYFVLFSTPVMWVSLVCVASLVGVVGLVLAAIYGVLNGKIQTAMEASDPIVTPSAGVTA